MRPVEIVQDKRRTNRAYRQWSGETLLLPAWYETRETNLRRTDLECAPPLSPLLNFCFVIPRPKSLVSWRYNPK